MENTHDKDVQAAEGEEEECRDKSEVVDVVRENGGADEALEDTESADTEVGTKNGEILVKELHGPADFREHHDDDLEDNE